jgi:hypothetical protein
MARRGNKEIIEDLGPEIGGVDPGETGGSRNGDRNESQTVLRACEVLKAFRHLGEELPLTEVMERTGLPRPRHSACCGH